MLLTFKRHFSYSAAVILSVGVLALLILSALALNRAERERVAAHERARQVVATTTVSSPFSSLALDARAAIVWDIGAERALFTRHADAQLPLASLTKLMTALVAHEKISPPVIVTIEQRFLEPEGDSGLVAGEKWRLGDLIGFTLLSSSNDGARALAALAARGGKVSAGDTPGGTPEGFVAAMNDRASTLGLAQTFFLNETGLDTTEAMSGGYGSARDVALLVAAVQREIPAMLEITRSDELAIESLSGLIHENKNTNEATARIPGLVGGKTGLTDLAGGNLAIIFDAGPARPYAVVVLGSSQAGRFSDVEKLVWATLEYLRVCTIDHIVCT